MISKHMTIDEAKTVLGAIQNEGLEYTFMHHSDFEEIKDPDFHKLRRAYEKAHNALEKYLLKMAGISCLEDLE